jgi:hypothetical protein
MLTLPLRSVQISKTSHAIGLLILDAVMFGLGYATIGTTNLIGLPFPFLPKFELSIVLPLILARVPHHVLVSEN